MTTGTITSLRERGFGFIAPEGGTPHQDLFFHHTAVAGGGFEGLREGQAVSFEQEPDPRDPSRQRAVRVTPLDAEAAPTGTSGHRTVREGTDVLRTDGAELAGATLRVPVHEEELRAATRAREVGQVAITKDVIAEERVLEVPVTEERVRVERRVVDRDATGDAVAFEEDVIAVPLRAEEVELRKRTRVAEEIEVGKEAVQRTEQVAGTVRREVVDVRERTVGAGHTADAQDPTVAGAGSADEPRTR